MSGNAFSSCSLDVSTIDTCPRNRSRIVQTR
jgi:hypothetical protein